ncbi:MAG: winged helix-turn-helix transcriptional regulator [Bacteroidales bacterium]|nr:winged helix-turn-helix transcriptional regulator [Bacteroidales bacterium]
MPDKIYAVIAGELAETRKLPQDHLGRIPDIIRASFRDVTMRQRNLQKIDYEIIRLDEFLSITNNPATSLQAMIMLASDFRLRAYRELNIRADLRLSFGIAPAELLQEALRESDGTAFRIAADELRKMKRNQRLSIKTLNDDLNAEFQVACGFMDSVIHDWSDEQAEALFLSLSGENQNQISEELGISQPAVNRRLKAAHAESIEKFIARFESLLSKNGDLWSNQYTG